MASPAEIVAVDLNPAHIALLKLKLTAARHLPNHELSSASVMPTSGRIPLATIASCATIFRRCCTYWEKRGLTGRRQISIFTRDIYRYGLLGRFIGIMHLLARAYGKNPPHMLTAQGLDEQRRLFEENLVNVF